MEAATWTAASVPRVVERAWAWVSSGDCFVLKGNFVASKAWNETLCSTEKEGDINPTKISTSHFRRQQERRRQDHAFSCFAVTSGEMKWVGLFIPFH